jgi:cytochrome b subunit of formate dehydrogenase
VALGPVHVSPTTGSAVAIAWIRFIYLWLIGIVVGGMGVHDLLDLVHKARRPRALPRAVPVDQPERMPRVLRVQHGLVMVSFVTLVYTGFALTYPESWWAVPLLHWERQFGLRGLLHRVAAVIMLGALGWHAVLLVVSRRLRACLAGLAWSRRDLRDVLGRLAYLLGRRAEPPRAGKFSYVEKVEYWAFLWGSMVMVLTGVVLWFENVSLHYLPKWVTDIATAVHFYEAILATLAIAVWHFYWVMFDPEVYPMDTAWLTGRAPAARVLEQSEEDTPADPRAS